MIDRLSGLLLIGILGEKLSEEEKEAIRLYPPAGFILFGRNCAAPAKAAALIAEIRQLYGQLKLLPPLISIDQEGGPVRRLRHGFPAFPGAAELGEAGSPSQTKDTARKLAEALKKLGVNCNLAPVADLYPAGSRVLAGRCFGSSPESAGPLVAAFVRGLQAVGVAACVKHFPGHGAVSDDSHLKLPQNDFSLAELESHLAPFKDAIGAKVEMVMAAHLLFPGIDPQPVTFSSFFLEELLRRRLGFKGVVVSDDFDMAAVAGRPPAIAMAEALLAGLDLCLWGRNLKPVEDPAPIMESLRNRLAVLDQVQLAAKIDRVESLRRRLGDQ